MPMGHKVQEEEEGWEEKEPGIQGKHTPWRNESLTNVPGRHTLQSERESRIKVIIIYCNMKDN